MKVLSVIHAVARVVLILISVWLLIGAAVTRDWWLFAWGAFFGASFWMSGHE